MEVPQFEQNVCPDQRLDFSRGIVGGDVTGLVAQEKFAILEPDPCGSQSLPVGVFEIMHSDGAKSFGTGSAKLARVTSRCLRRAALQPELLILVLVCPACVNTNSECSPRQLSITDFAIRFKTTYWSRPYFHVGPR